MTINKVLLFGIQAIGFAYAQSEPLCNSVEGILGLGICQTVSGSPTYGSFDFQCNAAGTAAVQTIYSNDDCTGDVVFTQETTQDVTCDGITCDTFSITHINSMRTCGQQGQEETVQVNLGCVASAEDLQGDSIFLQCNGQDGGAMAIFYESADCSGDPFAAVLGETGCDQGSYSIFDCTPTGNERTIDASVPVYDDFDDLEEDQGTTRRPRRSTTRRPRSTIAPSDLSKFNVFHRELPGLLQLDEETEEEAFVKQGEVTVRGVSKEMLAMMFGVFALVALMVYFCGGLKQKKALNPAPQVNYGTVSA